MITVEDQADEILKQIRTRKAARGGTVKANNNTNPQEGLKMPNMTIAEIQEALNAATKGSEPKPDGSERVVNILVKDITGSKKMSKKGNEYVQILCEYRNLDYDKLEEKRVAVFDREQAKLILGLEPGTSYAIKQVKTEGYWVWKSAEAI